MPYLTRIPFLRYDDDDTFNKHLAAQPVADGLFAWSRSVPNLWAGNPGVTNFTVMAELSFVKPGFGAVADPWLTVEAVTYKDGVVGGDSLLPHWRNVVGSAKDEKGTLAFGVYGDAVDKNVLHVLAAYESEAYAADVHSKSAAAVALEDKTKDLRLSVDRKLLRKKGGFLYKGTPCA